MSSTAEARGNVGSQLVSVWVAWIAIASGLIVLAAWLLHVPLIVSIRPAWATMKPITAVSFLELGIALRLIASGGHNSRIQRITVRENTRPIEKIMYVTIPLSDLRYLRKAVNTKNNICTKTLNNICNPK